MNAVDQTSPPAGTPGPRATLRLMRVERHDVGVCFAVEGARPGVSQSIEGQNDQVVLNTEVRGPVVDLGHSHLVIDQEGARVVVRHVMPEALTLEGLLGTRLRVQVRHQLIPGRDPTVDARFWREGGELLLWARDGRLPVETPFPDGAVRISSEPSGEARLALSVAGQVVTVRSGQVFRMFAAGRELSILPLRAREDDAAFVLTAG